MGAPTSKTFVLKMNIHCQGCERKLKSLLQKIEGVHSTAIDAKQEKVTITGTVDPHTVIKKLEKHNKIAVLLEEQSPRMEITEVQTQPRPVVEEFHDQNLVAQVQQFSRIRGLKHVEVTYSKTVKLTFKGNKDELSRESDTLKKIVMGDEHGGGGGGGASTSGVGGGGTCHGGDSKYCDVHNSYCSGNRPPPACGCTPPWPRNFPPPEPPQPESDYVPSAPPWPGAYAHDPYIYEENPKSCTLM